MCRVLNRTRARALRAPHSCFALFLPTRTDTKSPSQSVYFNNAWYRLAGASLPVRVVEPGAESFRSVRTDRQVTISIDPVLRIRNNVQRGVDLEYTITDGSSHGAVAEISKCEYLGCETRSGKSFIGKTVVYSVYLFEIVCADGSKHRTVERRVV